MVSATQEPTAAVTVRGSPLSLAPSTALTPALRVITDWASFSIQAAFHQLFVLHPTASTRGRYFLHSSCSPPPRVQVHPLHLRRTPLWKKSRNYLEAPRTLQSSDSLTASLFHSKAWRILTYPQGFWSNAGPGPAGLGGGLRLCVSNKLRGLSTGLGQGQHLKSGVLKRWSKIQEKKTLWG